VKDDDEVVVGMVVVGVAEEDSELMAAMKLEEREKIGSMISC